MLSVSIGAAVSSSTRANVVQRRSAGLGETVVVIIFRRLGSEGLSIVSMRPASQKERRLYEHHQKP